MIPAIMLLLLLGLSTAVSATPPDMETVINDPIDPLPFSPCSTFEVRLDPLTSNEKIITFFDQDHNPRFQLVTGGLKVRLTNKSTGKSIDVNISGPFQIEPSQSVFPFKITNLGPTLFDFEPGVAPNLNLPRLALFDGRAESMFDAQGNFSLLSLRGSVDDACDLLS
jgi:hypothetical protein